MTDGKNNFREKNLEPNFLLSTVFDLTGAVVLLWKEFTMDRKVDKFDHLRLSPGEKLNSEKQNLELNFFISEAGRNCRPFYYRFSAYLPIQTSWMD